MDPKGHAAIVTGAASGLGAETAAHLAKAGVRVACLDINLDGAKETAAKIGGIAIRCDVTSSDNAVAALKPRETAVIAVQRGDKAMELNVTVAQRPKARARQAQ